VIRRVLMTAVAAACLSLASCASLGAHSGSATPVAVSRGCAHLARHQYEVCYAYIVNDTYLARVPYYKFGRDPASRAAELTRFASRFYNPARRSIERQVRGWPRQVDVSPPRIRITGRVAVSANLATATLHTVETWRVRAESGRVLFAETNDHHTITMHRTPTMLCAFGHCLHKWVVVRIR
jgi:hypothetical protein